MKKMIPLLILCILTSCNRQMVNSSIENAKPIPVESGKIKVLNFATFHMGSTSDANSVEFDEEDKKNQEDTKKIAQMISKFKPTIICVEVPLDQQTELNTEYQKYLSDPKKTSSYNGEVGLVAFEVGRMSKVTQLYGIDYEMEYNYNIGNEMTNSLDPTTISNFYANPFKFYPKLNVKEEELSLLDRLRLGNSAECLNFLITVNADILTFIGTKTGYEGADEAAKYYKRNLRIFSNLNRIPTTKEDRIFILSGGSHAAFLKEFMERSIKYEVVNTLDYLN